MESAGDLFLFSLDDVFPNGFGGALHRLGGHLQTGQNLHLLLSPWESGLVPEQGQHTAYSRGILGLLHIQLLIDGELAFSALPTEVVRQAQFHLSQNTEQTLGT